MIRQREYLTTTHPKPPRPRSEFRPRRLHRRPGGEPPPRGGEHGQATGHVPVEDEDEGPSQGDGGRDGRRDHGNPRSVGRGKKGVNLGDLYVDLEKMLRLQYHCLTSLVTFC